MSGPVVSDQWPFLSALPHRQLLECEKNLTNMMCRELITMVTPIRECPLDMIVEECLVDTTPTSLYLERSPQSALDSLLVSPSHYFFKTPNPVRAALEDMVATGSLSGMKEIVRELGRKPLLMTTMSFPLGKDGETEGDFIFPGAALLLVTCSPQEYKNCLPRFAAHLRCDVDSLVSHPIIVCCGQCNYHK